MAKLLEHKGIVTAVGEKMVEVEFTVEEACAGCKAKELCGKTDSGDRRFVTVYEPLAEYFAVGEEVMVMVSESAGIKAAMWAYIVPLVVLLGSLALTAEIGWGKLASGLATLGMVALYYVVLWMFRKKIEKEIVFKIRKI